MLLRWNLIIHVSWWWTLWGCSATKDFFVLQREHRFNVHSLQNESRVMITVQSSQYNLFDLFITYDDNKNMKKFDSFQVLNVKILQTEFFFCIFILKNLLQDPWLYDAQLCDQNFDSSGWYDLSKLRQNLKFRRN